MVVATAVEHLDALAADAAGDRGLQLELAQAYVRLARVQGSMDSSNLGERREALASLDKGLGLAGRAAGGRPAGLPRGDGPAAPREGDPLRLARP